MAWTEITRTKYQRDGLRYASDTTDFEWAVIEPHMPPTGKPWADVRIPTQSGQAFRFESGPRSDLKAATIPI